MLQIEKKLFWSIKTKFSKVPKITIFQRGSPMLLIKKCQFFLYLFLAKTRLEMRFKNVLDRKKKRFIEYKNKLFQSPKNSIFPKGLTQAICQKIPIFFFICFGQN